MSLIKAYISQLVKDVCSPETVYKMFPISYISAYAGDMLLCSGRVTLIYKVRETNQSPSIRDKLGY